GDGRSGSRSQSGNARLANALRGLLPKQGDCSLRGACPYQEEFMPPSSMNDLFAFLTQLMTEHAGLFETMGANMFRGFAVILVVWYGVKTALASASAGHGPLHFDTFADLLITIAFGFGMITFYSHPIPGIGVSFYHLIIDQGLALANQLNHSMVQEIWDRL